MELITSVEAVSNRLALSQAISPAATSFELANIDTNALKQADFGVSLPDAHYDAVTSRLDSSDGDMAWHGKLSDSDGNQGSATFTVVDGHVAGYISTPSAIYELAPYAEGQSILMKIDPDLFPPEHPPEFPEGGPVPEAGPDADEDAAVMPDAGGDAPEGASAYAELLDTDAETQSDTANAVSGPTIDVLVVYTAAARSAAGGTTQIRTTIQNAIDVTNTSYGNSSVPQRVRLVHTQEVGFVETGDLGDALDWVDSNAGVAGLRDTHGADVVQLIVEGGNGCGLAYVMRKSVLGAGFAPNAYGTTARTCMVGNLSFAHEMGHNMGLEHDPANGASPSVASYPYAYGHFHSGKYRTVMSYSNQCTSSCPRAQYFSNPSIFHQGSATGITNQRDNARALENTDSIVGAFRLGKPGLISPTGSITDTTPTYRWNAEWGATWYRLWVNGPGGNVIAQWYTAAAAGCSSGLGTCALTPGTVLASGNHTWWVQGFKGGVYGPWSSSKNFTISTLTVPGKATLISPSGSITDTTPTYTWQAVSGATWYQLYVNDSTGNRINQWYSAAAAGCAGGTGNCALTPGTVLAGGGGIWWIRTFNSAGYGPWSAGKSFTVSTVTVPGKATLISPSGNISDTTPTYTWQAVTGATWYQLYVNDSTGNRINQWYTAAAAGCAGGTGNCALTPSTVLAGGGGIWWIRTFNSAGYGPWSTGKGFTVTALACSGAFNDQFSDNAVNAPCWDRDAGTWNVTNNNYYFTQGIEGKAAVSGRKNATYTNVDFRARLWRSMVNDCDAGGSAPGGQCSTSLWVRADTNNLGVSNRPMSGYFFAVSPKDGTYGAWKRTNGTWSVFKGWTASGAVNTGNAWNELRALASGSSLAFYVNGTLVWSGSDSAISSGTVAMQIFNGGSPAGSTTGGDGRLWVDWATLSVPSPDESGAATDLPTSTGVTGVDPNQP